MKQIFSSVSIHVNSGRSRNSYACLVLFLFEGRMSVVVRINIYENGVT